MTGRAATTSMDGTPISKADIARMEAEGTLQAERQRQAARVVAAAANTVDECRMLLDMLGLDEKVVAAARRPETSAARPVRRRSRAA